MYALDTLLQNQITKMTSLQERLRATAADNTRLLQIISESDFAPTALKQSNDYITNLKNDIVAQEKELAATKRSIAKEEAEHKAYQTSHAKRLAYRLGGKKEKFEAKASKEERDWVEAVQRGFECQKKLDTLNRNLAEATSTSAEMQKVANTYTQAQAELDQLYKSIFEGPTPDVPGEDQKESALYQATAHFEMLQGNVSKENNIKSLLAETMKFLDRAAINVEEARSNQKMDVYGFDNMFMEMAEHNALARVRQNVAQADMLLKQARSIRPDIGEVGNIVHAQSDFMGEVLFDNVFSDMRKYEAIKKSQASIMSARQELRSIQAQSEERMTSMVRETRFAKEDVDEKRLQLQQVRAQAYQRVADGGGSTMTSNPASHGDAVSPPDGPPPSYRS